MSSGVLQKIAALMVSAPAGRRKVLALVLQDPERVLDESFEALAQRAGSSVPTIMRTCRDLGYPGLREFKLALAQEMAVGGSPLHRKVRLEDDAAQVITKVIKGAASAINSVPAQLSVEAVEAAARAMAAATRVDCYSVGATSSFMASDMQARLFRLGLVANAYLDMHLQLVSAATQMPGGVVFAISHVGRMPSLIEAVDVARSQGASGPAPGRPGGEAAGWRARDPQHPWRRHAAPPAAQLGGKPCGFGRRRMTGAAVLLEQGRIIDGTGAPAWVGDVLLQGDRVVAMGPKLAIDLPELQRVDCRDRVIAPGFIDVHTHDDNLVLQSPGMWPKLSQGITTVVTGNCGISLAPYQVPQPLPPLNLLGQDSFKYPAFDAYTAAVEPCALPAWPIWATPPAPTSWTVCARC